MIPVVVRDVTVEDAPAVERVARASWSDTYRDIFEPEFIERFLGEAYAPDALRAAIERSTTRDDAHFLVAERRGEVIAYAQYGVGPRGPELFRIYADPAHYGTGAGSALLDELESRLRGVVDAFLLDVHSRNERGRAFYDRRGFVIVGGAATPDCDLTLRRELRPREVSLPMTTDRLVLRALTHADDRALHAIYGDPDTMRFIGAHGRPAPDLDATRRTLAQLLRHAELHGFSLWAVDERDGEALVGVAGLLWVEGHGPEVEAAYLVRRDRWGRGYGAEALRAVLDAGHRQLGLERVVALAYPENEASRRVMEKAGMRPDGTQRAYGRELTRHVSTG